MSDHVSRTWFNVFFSLNIDIFFATAKWLNDATPSNGKLKLFSPTFAENINVHGSREGQNRGELAAIFQRNIHLKNVQRVLLHLQAVLLKLNKSYGHKLIWLLYRPPQSKAKCLLKFVPENVLPSTLLVDTIILSDLNIPVQPKRFACVIRVMLTPGVFTPRKGSSVLSHAIFSLRSDNHSITLFRIET